MRATLAAAVVLLVLAPEAIAATASVTDTRFSAGREGDVAYSSVLYVSEPGEANDVSVVLRDGVAYFEDAGAPITAGRGCRAEGDAMVCRGAYRIVDATVKLRDADDRLTVAGSEPLILDVDAGPGADAVASAAGRGELDGGTGDDVLTGSDAGMTLRGGEGADLLRGGAGTDLLEGDPPAGPFAPDRLEGGTGSATAVYRDRRTGITVDLEDGGPGGAAGEGDVLTGIDSVVGGRGADVLRGDGGPNGLQGGAGDDTIDGRGGSDTIDGGSGRDRLAGGAGDDVVEADARAALLDGGAGDDRLVFRHGRPADRRAPRVGCGRGDDFAFDLPPRTTVHRDCELVSLEGLEARVDLAGPARGAVRVRLTTGDNYLPFCQVRIRLRATGRSRTVASARPRLDRRGAARVIVALPRSLRRALRRPAARLDVRLGVRYDCRSRGWRPQGRWRIALAQLAPASSRSARIERSRSSPRR